MLIKRPNRLPGQFHKLFLLLTFSICASPVITRAAATDARINKKPGAGVLIEHYSTQLKNLEAFILCGRFLAGMGLYSTLLYYKIIKNNYSIIHREGEVKTESILRVVQVNFCSAQDFSPSSVCETYIS